MAPDNPIRKWLSRGQFCYLVEIVASRRSQESEFLDLASQLASIPGVVGGSITNFAGGAIGHDPVPVGAAVLTRGLTPNVHLTCVRHDRNSLRRMLNNLRELGIENVFAMTGDFPKSDPSAAVFDLDSVQLVRMIDELRQSGSPYWIAVAVSPFKYREPDCVYQYLKLEKKIAAGANYAITQLGYDVLKFRELKRYLGDHVGSFPVLGNVYVLNARSAQKMGTGAIPGCWVSPKLHRIVKAESEEQDKGLLARLERAARMAAVLRGLGYAGAYLGGTHKASDIRWIIEREKQIQHRWEEFAEELSFPPERPFYLYKSERSPVARRGIVPRALDTLAKLFPVSKNNALRRLCTAIFRWMDRRPFLAQRLERVEFAIKSPLFGCQACGNCVLSYTEYVCPQTCPKQMRNGPCGGANNDSTCEVVEKPCVWVSVYQRAQAGQKLGDLAVYIPPPNRDLSGTCSWINYFLDRDCRPGTSHQSPKQSCGAARKEPPARAIPAEKSETVSGLK